MPALRRVHQSQWMASTASHFGRAEGSGAEGSRAEGSEAEGSGAEGSEADGSGKSFCVFFPVSLRPLYNVYMHMPCTFTFTKAVHVHAR